MSTRRSQGLDNRYTLVFHVFVDDEAAADALMARVSSMENPGDVLAQAIAEKLNLDPDDIIANPKAIEYKDGAPSSDGNTNSVAGWTIGATIIILICALILILIYGPNYQVSKSVSLKREEETTAGTDM